MSEQIAKEDTFRSVSFKGEAGGLTQVLSSMPGYSSVEKTAFGGGKELWLETPEKDTIVIRIESEGAEARVQNVLKQDAEGVPNDPKDDVSVKFANLVERTAPSITVTVELSNAERGISCRDLTAK